MGETRSAANFLHQARMWADSDTHMQVVRRMYQLRFFEKFDKELSIRQIRGMEGVRVRDAYAKAARETGVSWSGRSYRRDNWKDADPVNRALSAANACLYGICHAAIVSAGFSTALGFIHTGKMLSFVYDVADLYKAECTIPMAFHAVAEEKENLERRVRIKCREKFEETRILERIIPDIKTALMLPRRGVSRAETPFDQNAAIPGSLWDPKEGEVEGGRVQPLEVVKTEKNDGGHDS
jgi:CRISPR-associated protein Cas1